MCGRFLLDTEIKEILKTYKIKNKEITEYRPGDVYPSTNAPIILDSGQRTISHARWGFPYGFKKGIVINARSETIGNKPMFRNSFYSARCVIPANLFYEWKEEGDRKKVKHRISLQDRHLISLGGIFKISMDDNSIQQMTFVIITTEADENIKTIHSRMPLIIKDNELDPWLDKNTSIKHIEDIFKSNTSHRLTINRCEDDTTNSSDGKGYEQMKMF